MAETVEELTPLKKKLDDFGTFLSKVCRHVSLTLLCYLCKHVRSAKSYFKGFSFLPICCIYAESHRGRVSTPHADRSAMLCRS